MSDTPHDVDVVVGANIRAYRSAIKMSQEALGRSIGVTFQQIQKYENGKNRVSASKLMQISAALGCSPIDLLPSPGRPEGFSAGGLAIARMFDEIADPAVKKQVVRLIETIASAAGGA